jgi:hypothetical protein
MGKKFIAGLIGLLLVGLVASAPASGESQKDSTIFFFVDRDKTPAFFGNVESNSKNCIEGRTVKVLKKKRGREIVLAKTTTNADGAWRIGRDKIKSGVYIAKVRRTEADSKGLYCGGDRSGNRRVD